MDPEIYVPTDADRDPVAEAAMHMGKQDKIQDNALYDPWFTSAEHAAAWTPEGGGA